MSTDNVLDFLEHHGVKGMHWGVRNVRPNDSGRGTSSDFRKTAPHRNRAPSTLTNKQLKAVNERINLEQNYKKLNPTKIAKGKSHAKEILATVSIGVSLLSLANGPVGKAIIENGKKFMQPIRVARLLSNSGPAG